MKAAEIKGLVPVAVELSKEFCDGSPLLVHRKNMIENLGAFYTLAKEAPMMPTVAQGVAFQKHMDMFLLVQFSRPKSI